MSGNERESLKRAKVDKVTALNFGANDSAFPNYYVEVC